MSAPAGVIAREVLLRQVEPSPRNWRLVNSLSLHDLALLVANSDLHTQFFSSARSGAGSIAAIAAAGSPEVVQSRDIRAARFVAFMEFLAERELLTPTRLLNSLPLVVEDVPFEWIQAHEA